MEKKPVIGILIGDACGVGPEIVAKICENDRLYPYCMPVLIGDLRVINVAKKMIGGTFEIQAIDELSKANWGKGIYPMLDQKDVDPKDITIGEVSEIAGRASRNMLMKAIDLSLEGQLEGFAFAPLNKIAMKLGGLHFESENKLFAHYMKVEGPTCEVNVLDNLWTSRVTSHIPIKDVSENLTVDAIIGAIRLIHNTLRFANVEDPAIGVTALNPHGGEDGTCGREELDVIIPAIEKAKEEGMNVLGPYPSDILFIKAFDGEFDAAVTMYHDQGQIALKLKGFQYGITFHANLPVAIATAAHGTAFDIAGKGIATTDAMENAVKMVAQVALGIRTKK